jgi:hypothetical protein
MGQRLDVRVATALVAAIVAAALAAPAGAAKRGRYGPEGYGRFSEPFSEPTIKGEHTEKKCITEKHGGEEHRECKPAASSVAVLPNGNILYFNALEGTENIKNGIAAEFGKVSINDQTRVLDLSGPSWSVPKPKDGGANPKGYENDPVLPPPLSSTEKYNDGALFCSDLEFLADGRVLAAGGTAYYNDPGTNDAGVVELEGLRNARIYDPKTNNWKQTGDMHYGRWYPSLVTLGNGDIFVASGVQKLLKPAYPTHLEDSGRNVVQTETYDPGTGKWRYNGASADRSLPLFPRLHLLPNGDVYYDAAGQAYNPSGQSYDEFMWNFAASYDPSKKEWTDLGVPGVGSLTPGFRGSSFSIMLPLKPNGSGDYTKAEFLSAGGVAGVTPGSYFSVPTSTITTIVADKQVSMDTHATGDLTEPRWYSSAVLLPTGEVAIFSGANRDEVVGPGTGNAIRRAELFDPETETWRPLADAHHERTYHNTAALLPDGRILVGGHSPITTLYGAHGTLADGFSPNEGHDPTFEIFSPPYLFWGPRPKITAADSSIAWGTTTTIHTDVPADQIESVVLVRNTTITHLVDGDQRTVELRIVGRSGNSLTVATPPTGNVAPPGPYMLFVNEKTDRGLVPSVSAQVFVG